MSSLSIPTQVGAFAVAAAAWALWIKDMDWAAVLDGQKSREL